MGAVKLIDKFKPLYTSKKRYFILTGGRGSSKSFTVYDFLARLTYEKGHGILFTRYTMTSAEKTIIPMFKKTLINLGIEQDFIITNTHVINKRTKSFIFYSGIKTSSGDQTANLKSLPDITTWVIEEGEDYQDLNSFTDIDDSIRTTQHQNRIIWIQNPDVADENIIYQKFFKDHEQTATLEALGKTWEYTTTTHPEVEHIHTTYHDNRENLDPDKVSQWDKMAESDPAWYEHKYLGGWIRDREGAVFKRAELSYFQLDKLNLQNIEAVVAYIDPADRGTDSLSMPIGALIGDMIYIIDWYFTTDNQDVTVPEISYWAKKWGIEHLAVETNGAGLAYYETIQNSVGAMMYPFAAKGEKHSRIISNSGFVRNYMVFRNDYEAGSGYDKAMRELFGYNKDKKKNAKGNFNDDSPDSAVGLWLTFNDLFHGTWL